VQANPIIPVIARRRATRQFQADQGHDFEDLRHEFLSRKYSYKTIKGIYYNKEFLRFPGKSPSEISESDVKDYLLYLAEEKQSATCE